MNRIFIYLARFALIIVGYAAASLAASATLHLLFLGAQPWTPDEAAIITAGSFVFSIPFVALFIAYVAGLPGFAAILVGEALAFRSWLFYALAGGGVGLIVPWYIDSSLAQDFNSVADALASGPADQPSTNPRFLALMVASGIVGGLAYWLVTGRSAGTWFDRTDASTSPEP